jgi:hypothetical protein
LKARLEKDINASPVRRALWIHLPKWATLDKACGKWTFKGKNYIIDHHSASEYRRLITLEIFLQSNLGFMLGPV